MDLEEDFNSKATIIEKRERKQVKISKEKYRYNKEVTEECTVAIKNKKDNNMEGEDKEFNMD